MARLPLRLVMSVLQLSYLNHIQPRALTFYLMYLLLIGLLDVLLLLLP